MRINSRSTKLSSIIFIGLGLSSYLSQADVIGFEDFDGGALNLASTLNVVDHDPATDRHSAGDAFGRVVPFGANGMPFDLADDSVAGVSGGSPFGADTRGILGQNSTAAFGMADADGTLRNNATWVFDISSAISIQNIQIDIGAIGDWEVSAEDGFLIQARVDANSLVDIFQGTPDESIDPYTYRAMDGGAIPSENDPLVLFIDGVATGTVLDKSDPVTGLMDTYTSLALVGQSGSTLEIVLSWAGTPSGSEAAAFDNITINAVVPEPSTVAAILGLFALGFVVVRRRR
jgi:hypothetical protein